MARTALIFCLAVASLSAKDRLWQDAQVLDKSLNPYFRLTEASVGISRNSPASALDSGAAIAVNARAAEGDVVYDNFVIKTSDKVYLVELARLKSYKAPHVSLVRPLSVAVEKDKLRIKDLDGSEYDTSIVKKTDIDSDGKVIAAAAPAKPVKPAPAQTQQAQVKETPVKEAPQEVQPKPAQPKVEAKADKPKPVNIDSVFATAALPQDDVPPPKPKPAPAPAPAPKAQPKLEAAVTKPPARTEPAAPARPEAPIARPSAKDRAWQSGRLLSVANNNYFFNVTYTSDLEGSSWAFTQGSDGRYTVSNQIAVVTASPYTYDDYIIESQFCAYLVQRMRPKTSPPAQFPGTSELKFAVEKNKLWVLDAQGREYETKVIKLVQKDAIVDPLVRAAK